MPVLGCRLVILFGLVWMGLGQMVLGEEPWEQELQRWPFPTNELRINLTDAARFLVRQWPSNQLAKALIILPRATDELHFYPGTTVSLATSAPSWLDALMAFTRNRPIQVYYRPPFLLLGAPLDHLEPAIQKAFSSTKSASKLAAAIRVHEIISDENWERLQPRLRRHLGTSCLPAKNSPEAWHFWRGYAAGWNLNREELIQLVCLATQTTATLHDHEIVFQLRKPIRAPSP